MSINFDVPDKFDPYKAFTKVKFGENAPLLEVELNELQEIQEYHRKVIVQKVFGEENGIISGEITLEDGVLNLTNTVFLFEGSIIETGDVDLEVNVGDTVYLAVSEKEISAQSLIFKDGNINGETIENDLLDSRIGRETSRRLQTVFELTVAKLDETFDYITLGEVTEDGFLSSVKGISSGGNKVVKPFDGNSSLEDIPVGVSTFFVGDDSLGYPYPYSVVTTNKVNDDFMHQTLYVEMQGEAKILERIYQNGNFSGWKEFVDKVKFDDFYSVINRKVDETNNNLTSVISTATDSYNEYALAKDSNGVYTVAELRRKSNDSLYQRSTLSGKDSRGNYTKQVIQTFSTNGTTVTKTEEFQRTYDEEGTLIRKHLVSEVTY